LSSFRKRYRGPHSERPEPVSTAPVSLGGVENTPPASEDTPASLDAIKSTEGVEPQSPHEKTNPAEAAATSAIKQRLQEMERAEGLQREAVNQHPRYADESRQQPVTAEDVIAAAQLPAKAKDWLRQHTDYITDPAKNATIIALHDTAKRQAGNTEWTDDYFVKMEELLGLRPQQNQRPAAQPVRQHGGPQHYSAPVQRNIPSMSTGRPTSFRAPMTADERQIARSAGISDEEYQAGKEKMLRLKASGVIQNNG
jgi:hypothetical protein